MDTEYELFYWSVPFRGQFVRAVLAYAGKAWKEAGNESISTLIEGSVAEMPVPFMGPPVLIDRKANFAVSQMSAIVFYLGETLDLLPTGTALRATALKIVSDANDVIDELTNDGGREMWTQKSWDEFVPRLKRWMSFWEDIGRRHGLTTDAGFLLGGNAITVADIVSATLWSTMCDRFPPIGKMLEDVAPMTAALARRISATPSLAALAQKSRADFGDSYCGGQIEASLRTVLHV